MENYKSLLPLVEAMCEEFGVQPPQEYFDKIRVGLLRRAKRIVPVLTSDFGLSLLRPIGKESEEKLRDTSTPATFGYNAGRGAHYLMGRGEQYDNKVGLLSEMLNVNILDFFLKDGSCSASLKDL